MYLPLYFSKGSIIIIIIICDCPLKSLKAPTLIFRSIFASDKYILFQTESLTLDQGKPVI